MTLKVKTLDKVARPWYNVVNVPVDANVNVNDITSILKVYAYYERNYA